ncbi:DUF1414 domain-containing protein [Aliidiomarina quisquiliarum]|uniref:DUF1414 domain-containing protein n=1 Tax=Aliidiomarina quisquiliarum TaxID=2938947 RepID=UPI00208F314A|nr:DUF1414 domain-containing protein [Aliidiomarina quisquiliarum]MCO4320798.1 DUF1414 domain-containing protein [Aliidiomarina quisquiliarum]
MPIMSKYSRAEQDQLFEKLLNALTETDVPADLALMTLGNLVTYVLHQQPSPERRTALAQQFGTILLKSVQNKQAN